MSDRFVLVCGGLLVDELIKVDRLPPNNTKIYSVTTASGGTAGNIVFHLSNFGVPAKLFSVIGEDYPMEWLDGIKRRGADVSRVVSLARPTPTVRLYTDERMEQSFKMENNLMKTHLKEIPMKGLLEGVTDFLHISTGDPEAYMPLMMEAKEKGLRVVWDPGPELKNYTKEIFLKMRGFIDIAVMNRNETSYLKKLLGADIASDLKIPVFIETMGGDGVNLYKDGEVRHFSATDVTVVNPTGAGDAFRAGFYAGLHSKRDIETSIRWGMKAASIIIQFEGGQDVAIGLNDISS